MSETESRPKTPKMVERIVYRSPGGGSRPSTTGGRAVERQPVPPQTPRKVRLLGSLLCRASVLLSRSSDSISAAREEREWSQDRA